MLELHTPTNHTRVTVEADSMSVTEYSISFFVSGERIGGRSRIVAVYPAMFTAITQVIENEQE